MLVSVHTVECLKDYPLCTSVPVHTHPRHVVLYMALSYSSLPIAWNNLVALPVIFFAHVTIEIEVTRPISQNFRLHRAVNVKQKRNSLTGRVWDLLQLWNSLHIEFLLILSDISFIQTLFCSSQSFFESSTCCIQRWPQHLLALINDSFEDFKICHHQK